MRVRLYINRSDTPFPPGLYYGRGKRLRLCDDIWDNRHNSRVGKVDWKPVWHAFYERDKASSADPWYSLDINKYAVLT